MRFLSPFDVPGHEAPYRARGGEETLLRAIEGDPRRVIAIVGAARAGTSRLAIELAKQASRGLVLTEEGDPAELARLLDGASGRPMLVLEGERARRSIMKFVERELHPRLAILVPVRVDRASRLPSLSGLSRASIAVIGIDGGEDAQSQDVPEHDELLQARDSDDPRAYLLSALEREPSNARLVLALAVMDRDDARFAEAMRIGEPAQVLARWSRALELDDRPNEAIAKTEEWIAAEVQRGSRSSSPSRPRAVSYSRTRAIQRSSRGCSRARRAGRC